jgi:hypothetical protein
MVVGRATIGRVAHRTQDDSTMVTILFSRNREEARQRKSSTRIRSTMEVPMNQTPNPGSSGVPYHVKKREISKEREKKQGGEGECIGKVQDPATLRHRQKAGRARSLYLAQIHHRKQINQNTNIT